MSELPYNNINSTLKVNPTNPPNYSQQLQYLTQGDYTLVIFAYLRSPAYKANYTTHTKLDYKPPLSLRFNGKVLEILEWGEVKRDKSFKLNPLNLSNPKAFITESKDYQIKLDTIPMIIRPRDSYMLNITDTHNSNQATITNTNTQNIINPEIFIDDDFCKLIHILQQYKNQYKASEVKLEVGYENISNYYVDSEGYIQGAGFKLPTDSKGNDVKINLANFIEHGEIGKIRAIILHRTMSKSAQSSIDWWQNHKAKGAGTHFMIDKDGTIYQCASLYKTTWHVGARKKGITITNNTSIGIEVVAWYDDKTHKWDEATREQKIALRKIIKILLKHYNLTENDIYEHDKIANKTAGEGANLYIKGEK
ncbi:peptidoglycan recognition family protein [Helicobacter typhlonius]|uniref:N-acetylmuramoyl-L-alanine amidase n=1 Tax=Helicobacter typhlonius TaxID=76936 RepID=UPI00260C7A18|nr:peptidoglycan recognition family protein [uncultured Helicobacter sp.]